MTTMINPASTNRRRPSLGEQINRLDDMLDGLSEGLNEAVADAVKTGVGIAVKEAVQAVLTDVLTNPDMRARLFPPAIPIAEPSSADSDAATKANPAGDTRRSRDWWQRVRACIGYMRTTFAGLAQAVGKSVAHSFQCTCNHFTAAWALCGMFWPFRYQILIALLIGASVGIGVCHAEPWIAALTSGVGGFMTTLSVQAGLWLREVMASDYREIAGNLSGQALVSQSWQVPLGCRAERFALSARSQPVQSDEGSASLRRDGGTCIVWPSIPSRLASVELQVDSMLGQEVQRTTAMRPEKKTKTRHSSLEAHWQGAAGHA